MSLWSKSEVSHSKSWHKKKEHTKKVIEIQKRHKPLIETLKLVQSDKNIRKKKWQPLSLASVHH